MKYLILAIAIFSQAAQAEVTSARMDKRLSLGISLNDPAPSLLGFTARYAIKDYLRAHLGYGQISSVTGLSFDSSGNLTTQSSSATTIGVGVSGTLPEQNLTPVVGLHYSYVALSGGKGIRVGGVNSSGGQLYSTLGADWQTRGGLNLALGYALSFGSMDSGLYANAAWAVNWL